MSERPNRQGKFNIVSTPFYGDVSLGNFTQYKVGIFRCANRRLFVGVEGNGAYTFEGWCHYGYVAEKLGLKFEGDARNMADFINCQLGIEHKQQGTYDSSLCEDDIGAL